MVKHYSQKPSAPVAWVEVADVLHTIDQGLASLAQAVDGNVICCACKDFPIDVEVSR